MLLRLHQLALRLSPLRPWCLGLATAGIGFILFALFNMGQTQSVQLRLGLLFTLWMLMMYSFLHLFQRIPAPVLPALSWRERVGQQLHLWFYQVLALTVVITGLVLLSLTLKLWRL